MNGRLRLCSFPGCRAVVTHGRCAKHQAREPNREPAPTTEWDHESKRFLDSVAWRKLRSAFLARNPFCQSCLEDGRYVAAVEVDHALSRHEHPQLALDWDNLKGLCKACHGRKTRREIVARRRRLNRPA